MDTIMHTHYGVFEKNKFLIFYRATLSFGVFGVKNTTYKILSILMHI